MTLSSIGGADVRPSRLILAVVTVGRYTCAAPILEICRILHDRGHRIELACLEGWQRLTAPHPFVSKTHVVGRDLTVEEDEAVYRLLDESGIRSPKERMKMFQGFNIMFGWWGETYANIKSLCQAQQPDFIFADDLADACVDIASELHIPLATLAPQLNPSICPAPYVPGTPGYQLKHLTNEHASLWDRMMEELCRRNLISAAKPFNTELMEMRKRAAVSLGPALPKPRYLCFVNSFFGLEVPKDLPPLVRLVGPILAEVWPPLSESPDVEAFLEQHQRVLYVAFGTHIVTPGLRMRRLIDGIDAAMDAGLLDGVVWAMKNVKANIEETTTTDPRLDYKTILANRNPHWLIQGWVPQRAVLAHPSVCLFLSHCGASSTAETVFHGVPVLAMPGYGDQLGHSMRLEAAGAGLRLDKHRFSAQDVEICITRIAKEEAASFARNVLRLRRIAHANSQRKHEAAHMVEELLYDHELRFQIPPHGQEWASDGVNNVYERSVRGRELQPCHLETSDMRMSWIKRDNLDVWILYYVYLPFLLLASFFDRERR